MSDCNGFLSGQSNDGKRAHSRWGGWGNDLLNMDDDLSSGGAANDVPDTSSSYEDRAFGGAGLDVLIANTGGDRLIDWIGEFNSYLVPFAPFGEFTVSRQVPPSLYQFLYDLSKAQGADPTRSEDGTAKARNGGDRRFTIRFARRRVAASRDFRTTQADSKGAPATASASR